MRLAGEGNSGHVVSLERNIFALFRFKYSNKFRTFTFTIINRITICELHKHIDGIKEQQRNKFVMI
jgi:hypothetical protein